jgi:hypothetical protein
MKQEFRSQVFEHGCGGRERIERLAIKWERAPCPNAWAACHDATFYALAATPMQ